MRSLAVALLSVVLVIFVNPAPSSVIAADPTSEELAAAIRFRTGYGLRADPSYVRGTFQRPDAAQGQFGLPLSAAEAADMRARLDVQMSLHGGVADFVSALPGYAGTAIDQRRGGLPRFYFATDPTAHESALRGRLPGIAFEVVRVDRSRDDLLALKSRVWSARPSLHDQGIEVDSAGIDTSENKVAVGVISDLDLATAVLSNRFGDGIRVFAAQTGQADACTSLNECWPVKGGFAVDPCVAAVASCSVNAPFAAPCTSGFVSRRLDTNGIVLITAGHCLVVSTQGPTGGGGSSVGQGKEWRHNQHLLGQAHRNTWLANADADVGVIAIYSNRWPAVKNEFISSHSPMTIDQVNAWATTNDQNQGNTVCRTGRATGRKCGQILLEDEVKNSCANGNSNCRAIDHTWVVDFDASGGDSGGPVYTPSGFVYAYGIHTHSTVPDSASGIAWYSTINWSVFQYKATTGVDLFICTTSAC